MATMAAVLVAAAALFVAPSEARAGIETPVPYAPYLSKTATNLDSAYTSEVTLHVSDQNQVHDLVLVIDASSPEFAADSQSAIEGLLAKLQPSDARNVRVGIVLFGEEGGQGAARTVLELTSLESGNLSKVYDAFAAVAASSDGTVANLEAAIGLADDMLDASLAQTGGTGAYQTLVLVSDGRIYTAENQTRNDLENNHKKAAALWNGLQEGIGPAAERSYVIIHDNTEERPDSELCSSFFSMLRKDREQHYNGASGKNDMKTGGLSIALGRAVSTSSTFFVIDDIIGYGANDGHGNAYDFSFVSTSEDLVLRVGAKSYSVGAQDSGENGTYTIYYFGEKDNPAAVLYYFPQGWKAAYESLGDSLSYSMPSGNVVDESLLLVPNPRLLSPWDESSLSLTVPTVELTYRVRLQNPQTVAGSYGTYDEDGSEKYDGLLTNESAHVGIFGGFDEDDKVYEFPRPTVSYTVEPPAPTPDPETPKPAVDPEAPKQPLATTGDATASVLPLVGMAAGALALGGYVRRRHS